MAEPFAKPTKEQVQKLQEFLGDPLGFWAMGVTIKALEKMNPDNFDIDENRFREWKFLTRRMIWKFGLLQIVEHVYSLAEKSADEYWKNWTPPKETDKDETKREIRIDKETQRLKDIVKITDVAWAYELKVKGNKAVCPFHNDTNPSLSLNNDKGLFHCFGCGESGDIVAFIQKLDNLKWKQEKKNQQQEKQQQEKKPEKN